MDKIGMNDRAILRGLAEKQRAHAESERNRTVVEAWYRHNDGMGERPMVTVEMWTFEPEIIPQRLRCENETARGLEADLYRQFLNMEAFGDDTPVPDYFPIHTGAHMRPFGLSVETKRTDGLGYQFVHPITDLAQEFHLLGESDFWYDPAGAQQRFDLADALFGDILPPKLVMGSVGFSPTQTVVQLMGMETMFLSMYDYPDLFHQLMRRYTDDAKRFLHFLETERVLRPTAGYERLSQGSYCFTRALPDRIGNGLTCRDIWGYMDSQETVGLSPDMFTAFIFPYYAEIASAFGRFSYGCCEPVHAFWDDCLSQLSNISKVSISPWCDEPFMGERLQGRNVIFHRKPTPNLLGVGAILDEDAVRQSTQATAEAARGLTLEFSQRDVYTVNHDESKVRRYVALIRETAERYWRP